MSIAPDDAEAWAEEARIVAARAARARRKAARKLTPSEGQVQNSIIQTLTFLGLDVIPVENEARSAAGGKGMRARHSKPGQPDLIVLARGRPECAHLEVKVPGWRVSKARAHHDRQHERQETLRRLGHRVAIVTSIDEAKDALRGWGMLA